jgi:hypothetical protein
MGFVVDVVALGQALLLVLQLSSVTIIPLILSTLLHVHTTNAVQY